MKTQSKFMLLFLGSFLLSCNNVSEYAQYLPAALNERDFCPKAPPKPTEDTVDSFCAMISFDTLEPALATSRWKKHRPKELKNAGFENVMEDFIMTGSFASTDRNFTYQSKISGCDLTLNLNQPPSNSLTETERLDTFVTLKLQNCESQ